MRNMSKTNLIKLIPVSFFILHWKMHESRLQPFGHCDCKATSRRSTFPLFPRRRFQPAALRLQSNLAPPTNPLSCIGGSQLAALRLLSQPPAACQFSIPRRLIPTRASLRWHGARLMPSASLRSCAVHRPARAALPSTIPRHPAILCPCTRIYLDSQQRNKEIRTPGIGGSPPPPHRARSRGARAPRFTRPAFVRLALLFFPVVLFSTLSPRPPRSSGLRCGCVAVGGHRFADARRPPRPLHFAICCHATSVHYPRGVPGPHRSSGYGFADVRRPARPLHAIQLHITTSVFPAPAPLRLLRHRPCHHAIAAAPRRALRPHGYGALRVPLSSRHYACVLTPSHLAGAAPRRRIGRRPPLRGCPPPAAPCGAPCKVCHGQEDGVRWHDGMGGASSPLRGRAREGEASWASIENYFHH